MSDLEYDILDELYFVQSFHELNEKLQWEDYALRDTLRNLLDKGWIRCYASPKEEIPDNELDFEIQYRNYYYIASKDGLLAHNSTDHHE